MAGSPNAEKARSAKVRLCRLRAWPNYTGFGFSLEPSTSPPHFVRTVDSNSPAAAGGLRILDFVVAVNGQDVSEFDYQTVKSAIKNAAQDSNNPIELLVCEQRNYNTLKTQGLSIDLNSAAVIETPRKMPSEYKNFPKNKPRTCNIRLSTKDESFGFEIVNGPNDTGIQIQEVAPNSPAGKTPLRKSDRILEIDDKFVDEESSSSITEKLKKAKAKRAVKLYVVDTHTYAFFQKTKIPLRSKEFQRGNFEQNLNQSSVVNPVDTQSVLDSDEDDRPLPSSKPSTLRSDTRSSHPDDIRFCTINRADATDRFGLEVNYQRREQIHLLKITQGRNDGPSNAALAGVKSEDRLIEINGENVEALDAEEVKQRIRSVKYPQPLQLLVADTATYDYYQTQNKTIHSGLPSVRVMAENMPDRSPSPVSYARKQTGTSIASTTRSQVPTQQTSKQPVGLGALVKNNPMEPILRRPSESSTELNNRYPVEPSRIPTSKPSDGIKGLINNNAVDSTRRSTYEPSSVIAAVKTKNPIDPELGNLRQCRLRRSPGSDTLGFDISSSKKDDAGHQITAVALNSPAAQQGLRVGDYIVSVNGQNVEYMKHTEFIKLLGSEAKTASTRDGLLLEIRNNDPNERIPSRLSHVSNTTVTRPETLKPPIISGSNNISTNQQQTTPPHYTNNYISSPYDPYIGTNAPGITALVSRPHRVLSRAAVNVVSGKDVYRYCHLTTERDQTFGFRIEYDNKKHIIQNIIPNSPADRAGLNNRDVLLEVDGEDIRQKSHQDVERILDNAIEKGSVRLLITPSNIKPLTARSTKSLTALNDERYYRDTNSWTSYDDQDKKSLKTKHRSTSYLDREQPNNINDFTNQSSTPSEPLPRKCLLRYDPSVRGCGFKLTKNENYDTPIVVKVYPNSPAQRSGLTEGDHIIYIESQNIQNFDSFNDITRSIQRTFDDNDQLTLIALTGPAYQVLKQRGGYLKDIAFDYQSPDIDEMKPRLCKLTLYKHERNFGFRLKHDDILYIRDVEAGSAADVYDIKKDDRILELNGRDVTHLLDTEINEIIKASEKEQKLDILVIDKIGYEYSTRHAIPLNSLLPFVQSPKERVTTNNRAQQETVYL